MIANKLGKNKNVEAYVADIGSIMRCRITVIDKTRCRGVILDPTVTFEISNEHTKYINEEKCTLTIQQFHTIKQIIKF